MHYTEGNSRAGASLRPTADFTVSTTVILLNWPSFDVAEVLGSSILRGIYTDVSSVEVVSYGCAIANIGLVPHLHLTRSKPPATRLIAFIYHIPARDKPKGGTNDTRKQISLRKVGRDIFTKGIKIPVYFMVVLDDCAQQPFLESRIPVT